MEFNIHSDGDFKKLYSANFFVHFLTLMVAGFLEVLFGGFRIWSFQILMVFVSVLWLWTQVYYAINMEEFSSEHKFQFYLWWGAHAFPPTYLVAAAIPAGLLPMYGAFGLDSLLEVGRQFFG